MGFVITMEKVDLTKQFAYRLRDALIAAGYSSPRSISGVNIHQLAEMTGYSPQICRKYLRGQAIPEPAKLVEIAQKLKVSPGWLLFGDGHDDCFDSGKNITISKYLLHYILKQADELYNEGYFSYETTDFLLELIRDVSKINAGEEQLKKVIDLAVSSVKHFNHGR
tara:strand:+ start:362 stop:859 length:498 start_codon:yes stop_codon:yes gene_type:complete